MLRFQNILYFEKCSRKKFLIILHHAGDLQQLLLGPWNEVCHALRECRSEEVVYKILGDSNPRDRIGRTFDSSAIGVKVVLSMMAQVTLEECWSLNLPLVGQSHSL